MSPAEYDEQPGIVRLRNLIARWDYCNETFNQRFTIAQLLQLDRMWVLCAWDFFPDQWTPRQVREALRGRVPTWSDADGEAVPTYDKKVTRPRKLGKRANVGQNNNGGQ